MNVAGAVGHEDEAVVGERVLGMVEGGNAVGRAFFGVGAARGAHFLDRGHRVGRFTLGVAGFGIPAAAATLEVEDELGRIAGADEEPERRAVGARRVPTWRDRVPAFLQIGEGRLKIDRFGRFLARGAGEGGHGEKGGDRDVAGEWSVCHLAFSLDGVAVNGRAPGRPAP